MGSPVFLADWRIETFIFNCFVHIIVLYISYLVFIMIIPHIKELHQSSSRLISIIDLFSTKDEKQKVSSKLMYIK